MSKWEHLRVNERMREVIFMPDICMCNNQNCLRKNTCFRFKTIPDTYQTYFLWDEEHDGNDCKHYWKEED